MKKAEAFITELRDLYLKHPHVSNQTTVIAIAELKKREHDAHRAGMLKAAAMLQKRLDDYTKEHGVYDSETGQTEYPGNGLEYVIELEEQIEAILAAADAKAVNEG